MPSAIYLNLQVQDLPRSRKFWEQLGYKFNPQFSNNDAAALVLSDTMYVMLHTPKSFARFTKNRKAVDARNATEILTALQFNSKNEVDDLVNRVVKAGGKEFRGTEDLGFMYTRSFEDVDGHIWEPFCMDMSKMQSSGS
jgi:uncharacterized protein